MSYDLTPDFLQNTFRNLLYEFTAVNRQNNVSIPVFGVFVSNIAGTLDSIRQDLESKYNMVIYNPFNATNGYFQTNNLYKYKNEISFQSLDQLYALLDSLTAAVNYMNASTYSNYLVNTLPAYIARLQYAIQFITRYTSNPNNSYGNVVCDHTTTYARYDFNSLKLYVNG